MKLFSSMSRKQKRLFRRICAASLLFVGCLLVPERLGILRAVLFVFPYLIAGYDIVLKAVRNIKNGQIFDENLLMGIATVGAYGLGEYAEAVAVVVLFQIGELFQSMAVAHSRRSIAALMDMRPDYARLVTENGEFKTVSPEEVVVGAEILIQSGEKVPLDCVVLSGVSEIDTSSLTGESMPQNVSAGDSLASGSVNINGTLHARVTKVFGESTVSKILELAESSAERKSKSENFITKFARVYTPAVCLLALLMAVVPTVFFGNFVGHLKSALVFLVVSCPCALVISVPLTFFCGIGCASKNGILIKGAGFVEKLSTVDTVIFDKTGTLTAGRFEVTGIVPEVGFTKEELLSLAAHAERYSTHPIAEVIRRAYGEYTMPVTESNQIVGEGVCANVNGKRVWVGNRVLMADIGIVPEDRETQDTALYVAVDGLYAGLITVADQIKPFAKQTMDTLQRLGVRQTIMLTGDKASVGNAIGNMLGLDKVHCELLPADKVRIAEEILEKASSGKTVAYVGDGINDAPVLARADVGIAMGGLGSDAAIEAADVVLMDDKLFKLPAALKISRKTMGIVRQNVVFALGVKIGVMVLSAFGFTSMWLAIFADVGVSVLAILNALRNSKAV